MKLILASASPRRRELMNLITNEFIAVSTDADETLPEGISAAGASAYLAELKAAAASELYPEDLIIACDTTVVLNGNILGKPSGRSQCEEYLRALSGRSHQVITGCAIRYGERTEVFSEVTEVRFRALSDEDIDWYASTDEPYDKAGGYGIQGRGAMLVEGISGDYFNVVGLPVSRLNQVLKNFRREMNI